MDRGLGVLRRLQALVLAGAASLLIFACSGDDGSETADPSVDVLSERAWPTEVFNAQASRVKKALLESLEAGRLEGAVAARIFTDDFRGEDFYARPTAEPEIHGGLKFTVWSAVPADLDREGFRKRWNDYLGEWAELQTLETHTWEIQLRPQPDGRPGLETKEAVWVLGRLADGRLREDRFSMVLDLVQTRDEAGWRIVAVRSEDGRRTVGPGPFFKDVTAQVLPPGFDQSGAQIYTDGGPVLADFNRDGAVDLFLPRLHAPARLYENDGSGHFKNVTESRGLEVNALRQGSNTGLFLDFDRDGRLDLVVGRKRQGLMLFRNEGARFRDVTGSEGPVRPGEWESLAAADYDNDGLVDIYLSNYNLIDTEHQPESYVDARDGLPNVLLRNLGGGRFEDVTVEAGLGPNRERWSYAAVWADYDRDGDMDLYVANDYGPNSLYRNRGDGQFEEVAGQVGAQDHGNGMGAVWADLDGDLWLDLYVSNMQSFAGNRITRLTSFPGSAGDRALYRRFSKGNTLLGNRGDGTFEDRTESAGVKGAFWAWGNLAFDYDCDGDLDLFVSGGFYTGESAKDT